LNFYTRNKSNRPRGLKTDVLTPDGKLTTAEKKRILLNNIYGVDIDVNAVEITKLSLLLKCMEGETTASIETMQRLFHERVLPSIDDNICNGNSLIDTDFYDNQLDFKEEKKVKPFSWKHAFPDVFKQGGFDIVISNPPYVMLQNTEIRKVFDYTLQKYFSAKYKIDTYQLFIERSLNLLQKGGMLGFITPNTFLKNIHSEPLRKFILKNAIVKNILLFNYAVFKSASVDTSIIILAKGQATAKDKIQVSCSDLAFEVTNVTKIPQITFQNNQRSEFNLFVSTDDLQILGKITDNPKLGDYCGVYFGIQTFDRAKFVNKTQKNKRYEPVIDGWNIEPYKLHDSEEFVYYIPSAIKSGGNEKIYRQDRICVRQIGLFPIATFVPANIFTLNTIYNIYPTQKNNVSLKFLLGLINSNVTKFFWKKKISDEKKIFPKIKKEALLSIPIPTLNLSQKSNKEKYNKVIKLVDQLLKLNEEKSKTKLQTEISQIETKINYCEDRINLLVYGLYGLTDKEIKIVEGEK
jgi:hypothetical protein